MRAIYCTSTDVFVEVDTVSDEPINAYSDVFLPEPRQQPLAGTLTTGATIRAEKDHM